MVQARPGEDRPREPGGAPPERRPEETRPGPVVVGGPHLEPFGSQDHLDGAVPVGAIGPGAGGREPLERRGARMAVVVLRSDRDDRDGRSRHREQRRRGRGAAPVVRDLQKVEPRQTRREEGRVDVVLGIGHEQEASSADASEEDDRAVVHGPTSGVRVGHPLRSGPEDTERGPVDVQRVARSEGLTASERRPLP